jgi:hypothetical protein
MSIDLGVRLCNPISVRPLLPKIARTLVEMLELASVPALQLECLESGERMSAPNDILSDRSSPFFLISIIGEPECVGLQAGSGDWATIIMAAQRTTLEYALGAATAIVLAREMSERIFDDWRFFTQTIEILPEELLHALRVLGPNTDLRLAAEQLTARTDRVD